MFRYIQSTGQLYDDDRLIGTGYAGRLEGRNNPEMQYVRHTGPIPVGLYEIEAGFDHPMLGKLAIPLIPNPENNMQGRASFYVHGNNRKNDASHGCIIMPRAARDIVNNKRGTLEVVSYPSEGAS